MRPIVTNKLNALALSAAILAVFPAFAQNSAQVSYDAKAVAQAARVKEPAGLRAAAESGLRALIAETTKDVPAGTIPDGFPFAVNDLSELRNATLGLGFEVHTAHPQTLLAGGRPFDQMLLGTGIWNFVVLSDSHPVALVELEKVDGKWTVIAAGASKLAQDIQVSSQNHSGKNAFRFVRLYQATADFLEVKDSEAKARYVPLIAARQSLRMTSAVSASEPLATGAEILPAIQEAVRGHLARFGK
ncbi:MAG: hypothetical protein K2P84_03625 [Undibacterium sp.]|nr:hypothetical protein [Undibacterium sp.]